MKINKALWKGGIILLIAFGAYNFFNFLFQFSMARMLSVEDYGILAALYASIYIFAVFTETIQTVIAKYSSSNSEDGKIKSIIKKSTRKAVLASTILFLVYLAVAIPLSSILEIDYYLIALNGIIILFAFTLPITRGVMQGKKRFFSLGSNMVYESLSKVVIGVILVYIGWRVYGAVIASILASFIALLFSIIPLSKIIRTKTIESKTLGIYNYTKPTFFVMLTVILFYSLDIIIAKIVFDSETAGIYAIASVLAKIIFWGTQPISRAMFPISAENTQKKISENIFLNALILVSAGIIVVLAAFYLFPDLIISIFSGKSLPLGGQILFYLGIGTGLLSLTNLNLVHKLSKNEIKNYWILIIFVLIETVLLFSFSDNVVEFSIAFITSSIAFLWGTIFLIRN